METSIALEHHLKFIRLSSGLMRIPVRHFFSFLMAMPFSFFSRETLVDENLTVENIHA